MDIEAQSSTKKWLFSLPEILIACSFLVTFILWSNSFFETKEEGHRQDQRLQSLEADIVTIRSGMSQIANDTAYIRGRLEALPNIKKEN